MSVTTQRCDDLSFRPTALLRLVALGLAYTLTACAAPAPQQLTDAKRNSQGDAAFEALAGLSDAEAEAVMEGFFTALEGDEDTREELVDAHSHGANGCVTCILIVTGILEIPSHNLMHQVRADASRWKLFGRSVGDAVCGLFASTAGAATKPDFLSGGTFFVGGTGPQVVAQNAPRGNAKKAGKAHAKAKRTGKLGLLTSIATTISRYINPLHGFRQARQSGGLAFKHWCHDRVGVVAAFITEQLTHWGGHLLVGRGLCGVAGQCGGAASQQAIVCEAAEGITSSGAERVRIQLDTRAHALLLETITERGVSVLPLEKDAAPQEGVFLSWRARDKSRLSLSRTGLVLQRPARAPLPLSCTVTEQAPMVDWSDLECDEILSAELPAHATGSPQALPSGDVARLLKTANYSVPAGDLQGDGIVLQAPSGAAGPFRLKPLRVVASEALQGSWEHPNNLIQALSFKKTGATHQALALRDSSRLGRLNLRATSTTTADSITFDVTEALSAPSSTSAPDALRAHAQELNALSDCLERSE